MALSPLFWSDQTQAVYMDMNRRSIHALVLTLFVAVLAPASAAELEVSSGFESAELSSAEHPRWRMPVAADELRPFAAPPTPWGAGHRGADLGPLNVGSTIRAPAEGEISFAGVVVDRPLLSIRHADGYLSSFEPAITTLEVGDRVSTGDSVGTLAPGTGHCATPCLHWGVRRYGEYINPLTLSDDAQPSVLLPLDEL